MRALFLGFGQVGRRLAEILSGPWSSGRTAAGSVQGTHAMKRAGHPPSRHRPSEHGSEPGAAAETGREHLGLAALDLAVVGIVTARHGVLVNPRGIDLRAALAMLASQGRFGPEHPDHAEIGSLQAVRDLDYDVLVEMTPLSIRGRGEPAITHVREALLAGRHVVSCNKGPVAWGYEPLARLARERGRRFLFESTVMDGAPVFNLARCCLRGDTVERVEGILNSTTNVVLGAMEEGLDLAAALARAREAGVVEADPTDDLEGWDAAVKVAALANVLLGGTLLPEEVEREGIAGIGPERAREASAHGRRLKLVCEAWREGSRPAGRVALREVPLEDPFARVEGTGSILRLTTALLGKLVIAEEDPDLTTTAYGVISDLLSLPPPSDLPPCRSAREPSRS